MSIHQERTVASAVRVAEYEQVVQEILKRLAALEADEDLSTLPYDVQQSYDTALDALAALQLELHLYCHSHQAHEHAVKDGDE